jgi:outer membrane protein assembly factor BamB
MIWKGSKGPEGEWRPEDRRRALGQEVGNGRLAVIEPCHLVPCIVEGRSELRNTGRVNCKTFSDLLLVCASHATLYALDAATGKELYSTRDQVTSPGSLTGVTVANGRVFFTTTDNTLYGFGIYLER